MDMFESANRYYYSIYLEHDKICIVELTLCLCGFETPPRLVRGCCFETRGDAMQVSIQYIYGYMSGQRWELSYTPSSTESMLQRNRAVKYILSSLPKALNRLVEVYTRACIVCMTCSAIHCEQKQSVLTYIVVSKTSFASLFDLSLIPAHQRII